MRNVFFTIISLIISIQVFSQDDINGKGNDEIIIGNRILSIYNPYKDTDWGRVLRLKGQMHAHSTNSDGSFSPDSVAWYLASVGYDFWTMTDHNVITPEPASNTLIWMGNSYEHSTSYQHVCVYHADEVSLLGKKINVLIKQFAVNGSNILDYAHPWTPENKKLSSTREGLTFLEVWNNGMPESSEWDLLLSKRYKVFALAVDDFHRLSHLKTGWIVVNCQEKTKENIWANIIKGNYFCVNGVGYLPEKRINTIEVDRITLKDGQLKVSAKTSGLTISFLGYEGKVLKCDTNVSEAIYVFDGSEKYVRIQLHLDKMILWTQPVFVLSTRKSYSF